MDCAFCDLLAGCIREINPSGEPGRYCGECLCERDESLSLIDSVALFRNKFLRHSSSLFFMFRCAVPRLHIKKKYHYQLFVPRYHGAPTKVKPFYVVLGFFFPQCASFFQVCIVAAGHVYLGCFLKSCVPATERHTGKIDLLLLYCNGRSRRRLSGSLQEHVPSSTSSTSLQP